MGDNGAIRVLTNHDREFYRDIGPCLSRRDIVAELGFPVWDDDGKRWYVMYQGEAVVGFAAVMPHKDRTVFASAYVPPEYRGHGSYRELVAARLADVAVWPATAVATAASQPALERAGFAATGTRGRYTIMRKDQSDAT